MPAAPRAMTSFAAELRAGDPVPACRRGLWLTFLSPFGLEVAAGGGAEWIAIDVQRGDLDLADVAPLARVSPVPVLVRLGSHDEAQLARALDAGVDGVDGIFAGPYDLALSLGQESVLEGAVVSAIESVIDRTRGRSRVTGIFTGNRELTRLLPAVDLLGIDTDAASLRAGLKLIFEPPRPAAGGYGR